MEDSWTVTVDIFDVRLTHDVSEGEVRLEGAACNCDIPEEVCRHVALADSRVRAVFDETATVEGLEGTITAAPAQWVPLVDEEGVEASDTPV
ncbi:MULTISPECIES: hypothetical protein [Halobacterium]|uniref:Uncharacterized protein n=2 Tax=Halobacterium salinarum NRC-34001 TaxID=2886895 RepID=Q9HSR2_HALSA|nr:MULTISPECIES: hypothetical protein [Halobacterium]AAG18741.1 hypothetical protein VNG_0117H [Halobacterium salinarum NRC-1]QRY24901.1 hypothetical protein JRZ79_00415 [Halobacterium sp. BOL4-2]UEB92161.1 hypothetical protein LJ422_00550 [Halobacterium salinarum NRC-34001]CAP12998.1 uncharacterized protein OE_1194R [Halobacterium salinarum R1]DAC77429.1 TPA_inf: uncharacterized protein VNG_0117H [Halobacterium salinarum NRC-1]